MSIEFSYSCPQYRIFPKPPLLDIVYLAGVVIASEKVMQQAVNAPNRKAFDFWFGVDGNNDERFLRSQSHVSNMLAHARRMGMQFIQTSQVTLCVTDQGKDELEIKWGTYATFGVYSFGELVVTVLHELSHKTPGLKTKDVTVGYTEAVMGAQPSPISAYKGLAVKLAREKPKDAFENAENWGYYLASYHTAAGWNDAGDWKFTEDEKDINRKDTSNAQPTPTKGSIWPGGYWRKHEDSGCVEDANNLPIMVYKVRGTRVEFVRSATPLPGTEVELSSPSPGVITHVTKAPQGNGPHLCPRCNQGFQKIAQKFEHMSACKE